MHPQLANERDPAYSECDTSVFASHERTSIAGVRLVGNVSADQRHSQLLSHSLTQRHMGDEAVDCQQRQRPVRSSSVQQLRRQGRGAVLHLGLGGSGSLLEHVGESALSAVLAVVVPAHEDSSAALGRGALAPQALDLREGRKGRCQPLLQTFARSLRSRASQLTLPSESTL